MAGGEWLRANVGLGSADDKSYAGPHEQSFQANLSPIPYSQPKEFDDKLEVVSSNAALDSDAYDTPASSYQQVLPPADEINDQGLFDQDFQSFVICALIT